MAKMANDLPHLPGEDPFKLARGGFYRRWLQMVADVDELEKAVHSVTSTIDQDWVPLWRVYGKRYEDMGDAAFESGDFETSRELFLNAKTYYSIGRFPSEVSDLKREISEECNRAYRKACAKIDPPIEQMEIVCEGKTIRAHFRCPASDSPVSAVLIMCGADMFKEDRGWAADLALENGMAALVMDAPGTGENPFPWAPTSVKAWVAAVQALQKRPEIDAARVGAFGISRGGYSVLQLAGTAPDRVKAVVAIAGHPFHNAPSEEDMQSIVKTRNERAQFRFGTKDGPTWVPHWSMQKEMETCKEWSLESLGLVEHLTMPLLLVNGDSDGLAPIRNIYYLLEHGTPGQVAARVYRNSGHCAFEHQPQWGPASFQWLAEKLS